MPPGTGMNPANRLEMVFTRSSSAMVAGWAQARSESPRMMAWSTCAPRLPAKIIATFEGERRTRRAVAAEEACEPSMARYLGTAWVTAVRYFGTARMMITPATTRATVRSSRGEPSEEDEPPVEAVELVPLPPRSRDASPDRLITRMSRIWTRNPQTLAITPMETAAPPSMPLRPKKRMLRASLAAELGRASAMDWMAYWSMRTGPNRRGRNEAPRVATACATGTTGDSARATASHARSAALNSSIRLASPTLASAEMTA